MEKNALKKIGSSKNLSLQTGLCKVDKPLLFKKKKKKCSQPLIGLRV